MESAKTTKEAKIASRKADLITGNQNKKREIDTLSANDKEYCDDAKNNLVAESNVIKQMFDILNTGGDGGSGLRVVKDEVDGNMHSALDEAGTIDANADSMTQNDDFSSEALTSITKINFCADAPCQNGGTCTDGDNTHTCACVNGFSGANCETDVDSCAASPCQNGATCIDTVGATADDGVTYTCVCISSSFEGKNCETVNACAESPCQNGGTCTVSGSSFTCACFNGYLGAKCQNRITGGAGGWGGTCTCPDGSVYAAGDHGNYCRNGIHCHGGVAGSCNRDSNDGRGQKVFCGAI
jgi:hypothetical protein